MTARRRRNPLLDQIPMWLTGVTLGIALLMIVGLIGVILAKGLGTFWPQPLHEVVRDDGRRYVGLAHRAEPIPHQTTAQGRPAWRTLYRIGNREFYGVDFVWVNQDDIVSRSTPREALAVERLEWGPFYGSLEAVQTPGGSAESASAWSALHRQLAPASRRRRAIRHLERRRIGDVNHAIEQRRLALKRLELRGANDARAQADRRRHEQAIQELEARYATLADELDERRTEDAAYRVVFSTVEGHRKELPISSLVRVHRPNQLSVMGKLGVYVSRLREFVFEQPREANSEGGIAPAIFGTVLMTLLMTLAVVPLGVLAALYLHEYAKQGVLVSSVRIAVNNLAGVPSIVFGVFGLGFFCYFVGGTIDQLFFPERLPAPTFGGGGIIWASLTLALLTVPVVIVATEEALAAVPHGVREASLACGATKFQTIWRVVLPAAIPGILTGTILAMARGAGEVAPLMITGVVKLAPDLPLDHLAPFIHLERKFMHLGFHIYDVGFQSPSVEASKAMVYMTTCLLLLVIVCLNLTAMRIRGRLREQFRGAEV